MKKYWRVAVVLVALLSIQAVHVNSDKLYEIAKNVEIFTNVYKELNLNYVDELDPADLMKKGVDAMVYSLDPYTRYISESQIESFRISTQGKYSGIGAVIREVDSVLTVIEGYEESPAMQAGIIPGDQIISVNGELTKGKSSDDVRNVLRGAPGSEIDFEVKRFGQDKLLNFSLKRTEINIPNVPHYELLEGDIAYVHLNKFTADASKNIRSALREMKKETDLKGIILDLRYNGGGLLKEAIAVTNIFVDKGEDIVSTKGRVIDRDRTYKTTMAPFDTTTALTILINKRSASASEIVSGGIQDLDRGVLIGQKSFGKGLVQNTLKVGYNSQVKLTTSKYYIPSGRCIQSVAYKDGEPVDIPKEERNVFYTRNGRKVLDGGGVLPDIEMEQKEQKDFVKFLIKKNVIFKFVNAFYAAHDSIGDIAAFEFDDYASFKSFYKGLELDYQSDIEHKYQDFSKLLKEDPELKSRIGLEKIESVLKEQNAALLVDQKAEIIEEIEREIVSRYYFDKGKVRYSLKNDPELEKAIEILKNNSLYNNILSGVE